VAAWGIAAEAGFAVEPKTFRPVIRGALLTGSEPRFLRTEGNGEGTISSSPSWWPPAKLAAPRLGPYLAARSAGTGPEPEMLEDLQAEAPTPESEGEHREALRLALSYAEVDAREGEMEDALRWLDVAERLNVTLPFEYQGRREDWRRLADGSARHAE